MNQNSNHSRHPAARTDDEGEEHLSHNRDEQEFSEASDSLWRIVFSPTLWVLHFLASYIVTAISCSNLPIGDQIPHVRWFIFGITAASLIGITMIGWRSWQQWGFADDSVHVQDLPTQEHRHEFLGHASFLLSIVSFIGVCYVAIPAVFLDNCR